MGHTENSTGIVRLLKADEIECRAASVSSKGVSLLLYKDARVDQKILDETFGAFGWKRSHQCIEGSLYCTVEIRDPKTGEWIAKQDVGTTGYSEKEKSQASDSFKRACFNWGIGRELYTAPFIWVPADRTSIQKKGDRFCCSEDFSVASIEYNSAREITGLVIVNTKGQRVYELKAGGAGRKSQEKAGISKAQMDFLKSELDRTGVTMENVQKRYKITDLEEMPQELYNKVMAALSKTKPAGAA